MPLTVVLGAGPLLQLLLAHGEARQAAAVSTSAAKALLSFACMASRKAKEGARVGDGNDGGGRSRGGSSGGSSESSGSSGGGSSFPDASCKELHSACRELVDTVLTTAASASHCTLVALMLPLACSCRLVQGQRRPLFPTAAACGAAGVRD